MKTTEPEEALPEGSPSLEGAVTQAPEIPEAVLGPGVLPAAAAGAEDGIPEKITQKLR